jgi:hypothetical protein
MPSRMNIQVKAAELADKNDASEEIAHIRRRLAELNEERVELERQLEALEQQLISDSRAEVERPAFVDAPVSNNSPSIAKVELFLRLFAGRPDVFPVRWENRKDGRAGYSPACSNEWAKGICGKPKVKCGECPHQAFIPPSEDIIERQLRGGNLRSGDFVAGVYVRPLPTPHQRNQHLRERELATFGLPSQIEEQQEILRAAAQH